MNLNVKKIWGTCCLIATLNGGCCLASSPPATGSDTPNESHPAQGVVIKVAADHRQITIHHQAIPGYMMEMTMDFTVQNPRELNGLTSGDKVTFTLVVGKEHEWVEHLQRIGHTDQITPPSMSMSAQDMPKLSFGDKLPDGELLTEDGRKIHFSDFHGKVVAFTFFFTRCPLPDYCPLMNRNFAQTRKILLSPPNEPANWQLLSISFDLEFDQPQILANYAKLYRGDNADHWLFAAALPDTLVDVGSRLGLMVMRQDSNLTHNLRTIVLDAKGQIYRQFNDNLWTPQQLATTIEEAMILSHDH